MDRELVRAIARLLAEDTEKAKKLRVLVNPLISYKKSNIGNIYRKMRESPLVGVDLDLARDEGELREIDL